MTYDLRSPLAHAAVEPRHEVVRIAAVADIHVRASSTGAFQAFFSDIGKHADVLLLGGDLTDWGLPEEGLVLVRELSTSLTIPVLAVLGNHDYESGHKQELVDVLQTGGVTVLEGEECEVLGVGFAGVKGFAGGFGPRMLQSWGEPTIKQFVRETVEDVLRLESALSKLRTPHRIVLMHYAPIRSTVVGESLEIFPFLGSSRLEEPLVTYSVTAAFHGHAHAGTPEGRAMGDIPVFNVAMPLLAKSYPDQPPYRLFEVHMDLGNGVADEVGASYQVRKDLDS